MYILLLSACFIGCSSSNDEMEIFVNLDDARNYVTESFNDQEETLLISDQLNDPIGLNMAIIADGILKKGYMPNGFEQKEGYRIYKYIKNE